MPDLTRDDISVLSDSRQPDVRFLARQLLDALDRIEALESDRGPWHR